MLKPLKKRKAGLTEPRESSAERFRRIAWSYLPVLLRTANYLTRNQHAAEDLVQEAMLRALKNIGSFEEGTNAKAWLLTILRHTHIDLYRSQGKHSQAVSLEAAGAASWAAADGAEDGGDRRWEAPDDLLERFEDGQIIAALKALPQDIRWTLLLVDVEQLDHVEAAEILDVPVGTIKSRAHRGRAMLKTRLVQAADRHGLAGSAEKHPS
jgi:RNA polymerase sigma-70 factor (ECF subfamily)